MGNAATVRRGTVWAAAIILFAGWARAQTPLTVPALDWVHVGTSAMDLDLADLATGPVDRVWYTDQGALRIRTSSRLIWESQDSLSWQLLTAPVPFPAVFQKVAPVLPEPGAQVREAPGDYRLMYAFGRYVYRSEDGGRHWENTTRLRDSSRDSSMIGNPRDLAISPRRPDELTVASDAGVFRSMDGGRTWHGMNEGLPNLPAPQLLSAPAGGHGPQIVAGNRTYEWFPGEFRAWGPALIPAYEDEMLQRQAFAGELRTEVTAFAQSPIQGYRYLGDGNGNIRVRFIGGDLQTFEGRDRGRVNAFWVDPADPRLAIAVFSSGGVWRTIGNAWVDVTGKLPPGPVHGVTADRATHTVYVATDDGVFSSQFPLDTFSGIPEWTQVPGLPAGRATGVTLDEEKTQLWVALEGAGLYRAMAPHRLNHPLVVRAADRRALALAPGTVVSVVGANVTSAKAGEVDAPVLNATDVESQIQIPYNVTGPVVSLAVASTKGNREFGGLELRRAAPAIYDVDGTPLLEDAERGNALDTMNPGRSHMRVRVIAEGLGAVREARRGVQEVVEPVIAYLDRTPVEVVRAVLAPGYAGVYWVEIELPVITQYGMAELYLQVGGQESNRVRFYVEAGFFEPL